jgi:hypothetical protein
MSASNGCCNEVGCRRKTKILIRQGGLSQRWYAVTNYGPPYRNGTVQVSTGGKHDITKDIEAVRADALLRAAEEVKREAVAPDISVARVVALLEKLAVEKLTSVDRQQEQP